MFRCVCTREFIFLSDQLITLSSCVVHVNIIMSHRDVDFKAFCEDL